MDCLFFANGYRPYWYTHTQIHITSNGFLFFIAKLILKIILNDNAPSSVYCDANLMELFTFGFGSDSRISENARMPSY